MTKILIPFLMAISSLTAANYDDSQFVYYQLLIAQGELSIAQKCLSDATENYTDKNLTLSLKQNAIVHIRQVLNLLSEDYYYEEEKWCGKKSPETP